MRNPPPLRPLVCMLTLLLLAGCSFFEAPSQVRGNRVEADELSQLVPGTTTRADATALLGSPTAKASFDDNRWLYISEVTRPRIGRIQGVESQTVIALTFNDQGVLQHIEKLDQADSLPADVSSRTTPSPGTEATFMQQLFGNIGRYSGTGGSPSGIGGGAPSP